MLRAQNPAAAVDGVPSLPLKAGPAEACNSGQDEPGAQHACEPIHGRASHRNREGTRGQCGGPNESLRFGKEKRTPRREAGLVSQVLRLLDNFVAFGPAGRGEWIRDEVVRNEGGDDGMGAQQQLVTGAPNGGRSNVLLPTGTTRGAASPAREVACVGQCSAGVKWAQLRGWEMCAHEMF